MSHRTVPHPTAFVDRMPDLTADEYTSLVEEATAEQTGEAAAEGEETASQKTQAGAQTAEEGGAPDASVAMTGDLTFDPQTVTITAGQTIKWTNTSDLPHTVTADPAEANDTSHVQLPEDAEPFNSGFIGPEETYSRTFEVPGRYKYFCIPHEMAGMIGEIIVEPAE